MYILNLLDLPDVGKFSMKGKEKLSLSGDDISIAFESNMEAYEDYDPETEEMIHREVNEADPEYTGEKFLFLD